MLLLQSLDGDVRAVNVGTLNSTFVQDMEKDYAIDTEPDVPL